MSAYEGWHFLAEKGKLRDGSPAASVGGVETFDGEPVLCKDGLHASARAIDALRYAPGAYVRRVRLEGTIVGGLIVGEGDKRCATRRVIVAEADATRTLHLFACDEAERALKASNVEDERCWNAIAVKRLWLDGKATDEELSAARAAAGAAVRDAARGAFGTATWGQHATWAAVRAAAMAAAWDAAGAAAWAAAWGPARDAANERLERALHALMEERDTK